MGIDRRDRIAATALAYAGCSPYHAEALYDRVIVRPSDMLVDEQRSQSISSARDRVEIGPVAPAYFTRNKKLSTCALFVVGVLRQCGCDQPECVAPYLGKEGVIRDAFVDVEALARRYDAWISGPNFDGKLERGDVYVITDEQGGDGHMGICVGDRVVSPLGDRWVVETVEGGQIDEMGGSCAIKAFRAPNARTFVPDRRSRIYSGARMLWGVAKGSLMPVADLNEDEK